MSQGSTPGSSAPGSPCSGSPPHPVNPPTFLGQSVIPIMNKLQDTFAQVGSLSTVDLPQVAVVGSQSSGKSSVLEALVGRDFLPRGSDICTRRPLVLQLVQVHKKSSDEYTEWGEFLHVPGRRFTDFSVIRKEIQAETEREVGDRKGVSDKQIRLKIFSPHVLNITLVDLPGLTKVPVGDQPSDIESRIRAMIMSYIRHGTCIILAVSAGNTDLSNSDALQMAKIADPEGSRTIGVVTKLDIMDRGTDARSILLGATIPLRLGYIGVVNRSQEDIHANKSIKDALIAEEQFFRSRAFYHNILDRCGVSQLAKKLNQVLMDHIKTVLPEIKGRINTQIVTLVKELSSYGEAVESKSGQGAMLLNALTKYFHAFSSIIDGKNQEMSTSELSGGARIHYIFQAIFVKSLEEVDPCDDLSDEDIRTSIQNATGPKNVLFVPEVPFEVLVRRQIERLLNPSLQCARFIYEELVKISHKCETSDLQRFPVLRRRIEDVVSTCLREGLSPTETMITHVIDMEMDYINTSHPRFIGGSKAVEIALQQQRGTKDASEWKESGADRLPLPEKVSKNGRVNSAQPEKHTAPVPPSKPMESSTTWGISSIFGNSDKTSSNHKDSASSKASPEPLLAEVEPKYSTIVLREPPVILRAIDAQTEQERVEVAVTRLLLKSYYEIVRKNIQDAVPKAIMHFLVAHVKRNLLNVLIKQLYKEALFEEMLLEREEIATRRKHCRDVLRALQQASATLDELPLDSHSSSSRSSSHQYFQDITGLPKPQGFSYSFLHEFSSSTSQYASGSSPRHGKSRRSSLYSEQHSQQQHQVFYANGNLQA